MNKIKFNKNPSKREIEELARRYDLYLEACSKVDDEKDISLLEDLNLDQVVIDVNTNIDFKYYKALEKEGLLDEPTNTVLTMVKFKKMATIRKLITNTSLIFNYLDLTTPKGYDYVNVSYELDRTLHAVLTKLKNGKLKETKNAEEVLTTGNSTKNEISLPDHIITK